MKYTIALLFIVFISFCYSQSGPISVNNKTRLLVDKSGRTVIFHGVNIVYKISPYIPDQAQFDGQTSLTDEEIDNLANWGFNFVRLGVMWEAVERAPGQYNTTYLKEVEILINKLGKKGIYTLVDAHQDVFSNIMCGEGVPNFYSTNETLDHSCSEFYSPILKLLGLCKSINEYGFRRDENGYPLIEDCQKNNFAGYYTSPESISGFRNLYYNNYGLQDKFIAYWDKVSEFFSGNPYVIGYDPLNEPFPSDIYKDPSLIFEPGKFDYKVLQPLYERAFNAYQKHDQSKIMFFEPAQFPDEIGILGGFVFRLGFSQPPGGKINSNVHVLNDHSYCCQLSADMCATGEPPLDQAQKCLDWHKKRIGTRSKDAESYGIPLIISEFGACLGSEACVQEIKSVADVCDDYLSGWAYWEFKNYKDLTTSAGTGSEGFYNMNGTLQEDKVKALARTYIQAAQGKLLSMKFDTQHAYFKGTFELDLAIQEPTRIYFSKQYYYQNGVKLDVLDVNGQVVPVKQLNKLDNFFEILITEQKYDKQTITVQIYP